jgi:hypothetical protein
VCLLPLTPLHFSAIAPLHFKRPDVFDITALFYSSMAVDLELVFSFLLGGSLTHGVWHSYLFVLTIYPIAVGLFVYAVERWFEGTVFRVYRFFRFYPKKVRYPFRTIYLCCLVGGVSHIFFDMWTHPVSSYILFPLVVKNPFWLGDWSNVVFAVVVLLSFYTVFLWLKQALAHRRHRS